ncbi:serine/threonine-protein kinase [Actinophytocola gossypii]|uniref:non-specific serine/threonine protein kinase n=1 Tax=Actinophytocola gossypii TaxID=2812003 RepID=A0ABT2J199_9PSEU|nr:serine/threonine-protein kinase [Actinophytocola gossypii]MCT2581640.1 serine/threonine protein kinase [Actinophytocola gossypii]
MNVDDLVAGRYRLTERLGAGGMGVVWRAHDERLRRTVAIKEVLLPPALDDTRLDEIRRRTMREGRIAAKLHHPQLIAVYDVIEDDGRPFIVMEHLPSTSLSRVLDDKGALPPQEVARIGAEAAAALASAHAAGVVHRDVKPANILVGDNGTVKITDFGVSRVVEDVTGTSTGTFVGSPAYLAPEVAQGRDVTFPGDVYSLGATLYTAVEGNPPAGKSDNPMLLLHRIASGSVEPPTKAGPLTDILLRLLHADPDQRPTMEQARTTLAAIADGRTAEPPPPTAPVPPPAPAREANRRRGPLALAALFVVVAVATTLIVLATTGDDTDNPAAPPDPSPTESTPDTNTNTQTETTTDSETTTTTTTQPTQSSPTTEEPPDQNTPPPNPAATPAAAVSSYYALMPGNPEEGWTRLTPNFQQNQALGYANYVDYWSGIDAAPASQISAQGSTVEVTIDYDFSDGRQVRERHRYQLVNQNGRWLFDSVAVLSSTG